MINTYSSDDLFHLSIRNYTKYPLYETFIEIANNVTLEMVRGAITEDSTDPMIHKEVVQLALVYRGLKPITWIPLALPEFFNKLGLKMIHYRSNKNAWAKTFNYFVIWKTAEHDECASRLAEVMQKNDDDIGNEIKHQFIGKTLGYPEKDIDYYISRISSK